MTQLTGNDFDNISSYFENKMRSNELFVDPYTNEKEFLSFAIKDSLFNYRCLYYANEEMSNVACFKLRRKPLSLSIIDIIYLAGSFDVDFINQMKQVFSEIKDNHDNIQKMNISVLEKIFSNISGYDTFVKELGFSQEAYFYDEFGQGNHVVVFSRYV